jgi:hypothetical protein
MGVLSLRRSLWRSVEGTFVTHDNPYEERYENKTIDKIFGFNKL